MFALVFLLVFTGILQFYPTIIYLFSSYKEKKEGKRINDMLNRYNRSQNEEFDIWDPLDN